MTITTIAIQRGIVVKQEVQPIGVVADAAAVASGEAAPHHLQTAVA